MQPEEAIKALVTVRPGVLEFQDRPEPAPGPEDAVVAIEAVGVCGSDLHLLAGDHPYARFPNVQGHEIAGTIVTLPQSYAGALRPSERVAIEPLLSCGACLPCRRDRPNCCTRLRTLGVQVDGGLAERLAVPVRLLHSVRGLPADLGALAEPLSIGLHAVRRARVTSIDRAVILGAGPIGQAILLGLGQAGVAAAVVDPLPGRLAVASAMGASIAIDPNGDDVTEVVARWTDHEGPAVVFEASGEPSALRTAVDLVGSSGTVVVVGLSSEEVSLPMIAFTRKELAVVGSRNSLGEFDKAIDLLDRRQDDLRQMISHRFQFADAAAAFRQAAEQRASSNKIIVMVDDES